ncbi:MAG: HvfC/BufC family peptide modification chaperone, partial [Casimicrobiaceae bacterium]
MSAATIFGDRTTLAALGVVAGAIGAAARIEIYRDNLLGNYKSALAATFPVVRRLVGAPFFDAAVEAFVRACPSTRGDVNRYGGELSRFLASYGPAQGLDYLPDVACLEWAIDQAGIAADAPPFDFRALAAVPEALHRDLCFVLHPSAQLLESRFPILRIWQVNRPDCADPPPIDLGEGGDSLLIVRGAPGMRVERLGTG